MQDFTKQLQIPRPLRRYFRERVTKGLSDVGIVIDGDNPWDISVHDERFFTRVARDGTLEMGESYMNSWWDCPALEQLSTPRLVPFPAHRNLDPTLRSMLSNTK